MARHASAAGKRARALGEVRALGAGVDRLDGAAAARLGLNRTDMRVLELLNRRGAISASELARATELTTAGVTTAMDRVEARGLAVRTYDRADRRRVLIEPTIRAAQVSDELFADLLASIRSLLADHSDQQLDTLLKTV